jgi:hypothetical protein
MSVVEFRPPARPEPEVWQCRCGCYTFWLSSDGAVHCSDCQQEATSMRGFWRIPERAEPVTSADLANVVFIFDNKREQTT